MSSALDSKAVFEEKLQQMGLITYLGPLAGYGWDTIAGFAFSTAYQPGLGDEKPFVDAVLVPLLGRPDHVDAAGFREFFWECRTIVTADLRRRVESSDDVAPKAMPNAERESRRAMVRARLTGLALDMDNELDPAHCLVDFVASMYDDNRITAIDWKDAPKRGQELRGERKVEQYRKDAR